MTIETIFNHFLGVNKNIADHLQSAEKDHICLKFIIFNEMWACFIYKFPLQERQQHNIPFEHWFDQTAALLLVWRQGAGLP